MSNSLTAVLAGARQIQGTINGLGERCGNANLMSIIPTLFLKTFSDKFDLNINKKLSSLTECSRFLDEVLNKKPNKSMAYVGGYCIFSQSVDYMCLQLKKIQKHMNI